jgi:flagellar FliJ protein
MSSSDRFKPIQKLASHKERKAAAALGASLKQREAARQRLDELKQYLAEYLERYASAAGNGLPGNRILEYQVFIGKLQAAIAEQEKIVSLSQQECDSSKAQWRGRYTKTKAMSNAVDRIRNEERRQEERKEQSETDNRSPRRR